MLSWIIKFNLIKTYYNINNLQNDNKWGKLTKTILLAVSASVYGCAMVLLILLKIGWLDKKNQHRRSINFVNYQLLKWGTNSIYFLLLRMETWTICVLNSHLVLHVYVYTENWLLSLIQKCLINILTEFLSISKTPGNASSGWMLHVIKLRVTGHWKVWHIPLGFFRCHFCGFF